MVSRQKPTGHHNKVNDQKVMINISSARDPNSAGRILLKNNVTMYVLFLNVKLHVHVHV